MHITASDFADATRGWVLAMENANHISINNGPTTRRNCSHVVDVRNFRPILQVSAKPCKFRKCA